MKPLQARLEKLENEFRSESSNFLKMLYSVHDGKYHAFGDIDNEGPVFASIDDLRKYYAEQGFKEIDIYTFKMPGTMPHPLAKPTPKERPNIKRVLISVMGECDYSPGAHYPNTEEFTRMREKYDNI